MTALIRFVIVIAALVAIFYVYRWFNYTLAYESMVKDTIREMVKEEALKK